MKPADPGNRTNLQRSVGNGLSPLVSAGPTRAHLRLLIDSGGSSRTIAAAAGVTRRTVSEVLSGQRRRIRKEVSIRLFSVTADELELSPQRRVGSLSTLARVGRLMELGYSESWIASQLGYGGLRQRLAFGPVVTVRTEQAVLHLFERIGGRPAAESVEADTSNRLVMRARPPVGSSSPHGPQDCPGEPVTNFAQRALAKGVP